MNVAERTAPVAISRCRPFDTPIAGSVAVPTMTRRLGFGDAVVDHDGVTEVLVELLERPGAEHDLVGCLQPMPGEQRRRDRGELMVVPSTGTVSPSSRRLSNETLVQAATVGSRFSSVPVRGWGTSANPPKGPKSSSSQFHP